MLACTRCVVALVAVSLVGGCAWTFSPPGDSGGDLASQVAGKALAVADTVGGSGGYGGAMMEGYVNHAPERMGFHGVTDLAGADRTLAVRLHNELSEDCTFDLSYVASHMGINEQTVEVEVGAGEEVVVEIPCPEILGFGPLEMPGATGCHLVGGQNVDNTMALPGFLGLDYTCDSSYDCFLRPDSDDLDGDGNTEELALVVDAIQFHAQEGGPFGHLHGMGPGMMGSHMGHQ